MQPHNIQEIIVKYFNATTSLEEEQLLKQYFHQEKFPDRLKPFQVYFGLIGPTEELLPDEGFDKKLMLLVDSPVRKTSNHIHKQFLKGMSVAASIVVILMAALMFYNYPTTTNRYNQAKTDSFEDTYQDPQQARIEIEKALSYISLKMNQAQNLVTKSTDRLQHLPDPE